MICLIGEKLYQWDIGRQVEINYPEGSIGDVHFSNIDGTEALVVEPFESDGKIVANIPNILLQHYKPLRVYLTVLSANGEKTVSHKSFTIIRREKPSDYAYVETEVKTWDSLDKRLSVLEKSGGFTGGIPSGGKAGQILTKKSDEDFDAEWSDLVIPSEYGRVTYNQDKTIIVS